VSAGISVGVIAPGDAPPPPLSGEPTPRRVFLAAAARERVDAVARACAALAGAGRVRVVAAFSFKTNPGERLIAMARERGFAAEVISPEELRWARELGFTPADTIYNGPLPVGRDVTDEPLGWIFADSLEAYRRNARSGVARACGARLRPSMLASRFGVAVDEDDALAGAVAEHGAASPFAVSFHARREDFHGATWRDVAGDVLRRAAALQARAGAHVVGFDAGGGWTPDEFDETFAADIGWLVDRLATELPACTTVIVEPGQAVCTPSEALLTRVLEVRRRGERREVIVDAGYPDWPQMHAYVHGFFAWRAGGWTPLGRGADRLGGRTCLEYDVIDGLRFPDDVAEGDALMIVGTGSYDRSMAFDFARGTTADV